MAVASAIVSLSGWAQTVHLLPSNGDVDVGPGVDILEIEPTALGDEPTSKRLGSLKALTNWIVYTSGTTGVPKPVSHTLPSLSRTARSSVGVQQLVWGFLYIPTQMAGLQVLLQAMVAGSKVAVPNPQSSLTEKVRWMRRHQVSALSATPTLWRQVLQSGDHTGWRLRQITLGGEIADQKLINGLALAFPQARVTHVFASTEIGAAFSVSDGLAGFPAKYLEEPPSGIPLRIVDHELQVFSPGAQACEADGFVSTGDLVEFREDRVMFIGRDASVVNIGGTKVWPEQVEVLIRSHPDVVDAVVIPKSNSFSGVILTARVVLRPESHGCSGKAIRSWLRERVPATQVPATVTVVQSLEVSPTGKTERR
jgi:acyl-coenzyme A synthetase/AMP-(fatty) acid ligase